MTVDTDVRAFHTPRGEGRAVEIDLSQLTERGVIDLYGYRSTLHTAWRIHHRLGVEE